MPFLGRRQDPEFMVEQTTRSLEYRTWFEIGFIALMFIALSAYCAATSGYLSYLLNDLVEYSLAGNLDSSPTDFTYSTKDCA